VFNTLRLLTATATLVAGTAAPHQSTASGASSVTAAVVATQSERRGRLPPGALDTALNAGGVSDVRLANVVRAGSAIELDGQLTQPHVLDAQVADVIVRVRGGAVCSGTPITGTRLVITAAHCVLDADGAVTGSGKVLRDGVEYTPVSVLVNPAYHDSPNPRLDAAVLVMDQIIPGPSATLGHEFPAEGLLTVAGFQPLATDGSLLRGTRYDNRPLPRGAIGGVVEIDTAVAGCVQLASDAEIAKNQVKLPCGLIPGASGGGVFVENHGVLTLVGVISTVAFDLTFNGVVPLAELHELLENPAPYTYDMTVEASTSSVAKVVRS
jgi:Trypsin-like peptidase domain